MKKTTDGAVDAEGSSVERVLRKMREAERAVQDAGGCSAMSLEWVRCGARITHRTESFDMPLCSAHVARLSKSGLTCEISDDHWVGLHPKTKTVKAGGRR